MRIQVAAGILRDPRGRVLLTERLNDPPFRGCWEFPGGKIDPDESPASALRRELAEELGIEVTACEPFLTLDHDYPDRLVRLEFFLVTGWRSRLRAMDGQQLRWVLPAEIDEKTLLPADAPVIEALRRVQD